MSINSYVVNGAVHYANALASLYKLHGNFAIGMTGYKTESGELKYEIGVCTMCQKKAISVLVKKSMILLGLILP